MTVSSRKKGERETRRKEIIDAAEKIIFSKGLEHATMEEIAEEAVVSKGTLYYYFKNKDDLYFALNNRGLAYLNQRFANVLTENIPGVELVRRMGEEFIDFVRTQPDYFDAMMHYERYEDFNEIESTQIKERCKNNEHQAFTFTIRALQIGMQDGTINSKYSPERLAIQIWASIRGLTQMYHLHKKGHYREIFKDIEPDFDHLFEDSLELLFEGMELETTKT